MGTKLEIRIPITKNGRKNKEDQIKYNQELNSFCDDIIQINNSIDFNVGLRGWCYLLEGYGLLKSDFNKAEALISKCRKTGLLPIDICADDSNRSVEGIIEMHNDDVSLYADEILNYLTNTFSKQYNPIDFWDYQNVYVEVMVEKIDLKGLFGPICDKYHVLYGNNRGWADINSRAVMMSRFAEKEADGKQCILLYCGDHDPAGLNISDKLKKNLADLAEAVGWKPDNLIVDRFGLNYDFITKNNLTWIENLETSSGGRLDNPRHPDYNKPYVKDYISRYGSRKVEANSLVVRVQEGRDLCENTILKYIDLDGVKQYNEDIKLYRDELKKEFRNRIK